jgi:hypothetical protein
VVTTSRFSSIPGINDVNQLSEVLVPPIPSAADPVPGHQNSQPAIALGFAAAQEEVARPQGAIRFGNRLVKIDDQARRGRGKRGKNGEA